MICSFLLTKSVLALLKNQYFTHLMIISLYTNLGLTDIVLQWFSYYLTDRPHYVSLSNHFSAFAPVHSGVPLGSFLVHTLFTMHTKPFLPLLTYSIIQNSLVDGLLQHMSARPVKISVLLHSMESYVSYVKP